MTKYLLLLIFNLLPLWNIQAQIIQTKQPQNEIGLQVGTDFTSLKDLNFSPLINKGRGYGLHIDYVRKTKKDHAFFINLQFSNGTLSAKASDFFKYDQYLANFEVGYLSKILDKKDQYKVHVGAIVSSRIAILDYRGFSAVTFSNFHGLSLSSRLVYSPKEKHSFTASFSIPVLGKLSRPAYTGWDKFTVENKDNILKVLYRGKWTSVNHLLGLDLQLGYRYTLSDQLDLTAQHRLSYFRTDTPKTAIMLRNYTSLGLNFKF